jgi:hypothetical protein
MWNCGRRMAASLDGEALVEELPQQIGIRAAF